jgi:U3 small nucleolar RNA-associated protein MPP10
MSQILHKLISDPTAVIDPSVDSSDVLGLVKTIFDPITKGYSVLDEIYVDGLDASQVWPQAKIILDNVTDSLLFERIPQLKGSAMNSGNFSQQELSDDSQEVDEDEDENEDEENENEQEGFGDFVDDYEEEPLSDDQEGYSSAVEDQTKHQHEEEQTEDKKDAFGLNDGFFSIDDFNKQILAHENENGNTGADNDEDIDYFGDIPDSDDEEVAYYDDFFAKPKSLKEDPKKSKKQPNKSKKKQEEEQELNDEDFDNGMKSAMLDLFDEEEPEQPEAQAEKNLSSFERQQLQIQNEISKLEQEAIAEKKWAMKGEAKAKDRPADALLEEDLEFERTAKPVPVITREVTESLEEMIRRRIKEGNFDDLPRRIITDVTNFRPSSSFKLSEEKSSKSLAEMYEEEYKGVEDNQVSEELQKAHDEIKELFTSISFKLDALSSAHFIPKPAQKAIDIRVNAPTISMEDAQPLTQSSASTLAPQEIYKATTSGNDTEIQLKSGTVFSRDELSREDKQRMRRANKRKRAKEFKEREQRGPVKKSKKQDVIDTLSKAKNVTVIDSKGQRRDVDGSVKKDKVAQGISSLKS